MFKGLERSAVNLHVRWIASICVGVPTLAFCAQSRITDSWVTAQPLLPPQMYYIVDQCTGGKASEDLQW